MADRSGERSEWEARLADVVDALQGIGLELEGIKMCLRAVAIEKAGRDPLRGTYLEAEPGEEG